MKLKHALAATAIAALVGPAFAGDQSVDLSSGTVSFVGTQTILEGGDDAISFAGLAAGTYNFLLSVSAQNIKELAGTLNGQAATGFSAGRLSFLGLESTGTSPFVLTLTGTAGNKAMYSGEMSVTAVPEPSSYALMLAGLAATGFMVKRRRA